MTVRPELCEKVSRLRKDKLDRVLRAFSHYAGYSYLAYKRTSEKKRSGNYIPVSGKVLDEKELFSMIDASLDMWLTAGRFHDRFETEFAEFLGVKNVLAVNSGSSANLLALSALMSHDLGDNRLKEGDEVITVASAFPTTVAPIVQNGLVPVFVDVESRSYNIDPLQIKSAISKRTKAIFIAHTLGNTFNVERVLDVCDKYDLFLIEDNCDALGSEYSLKAGNNTLDKRYTGTFGDIATFSFYPAHHITMGEGGAVATNDSRLSKIMLSIRDWGRDCWCPTGKDNTCGQRFSQAHGRLPAGYDHKYVYSHLGYNLKITDWQAAIGLAQLQKLPQFIEKRKENFKLLYDGLKQFEEYFILPQTAGNGSPVWFGFPVTVKTNHKFDRIELVKFLEKNNIGTRQIFAGNILRQPVFLNNKIKMRIGGSKILLSDKLTENDYKMLPNTDTIAQSAFWLGIWPGLNQETMEYIVQKIGEFINQPGRAT
ncbi:MAG: lipopolysaccharide biosynthesis protein RfbH [Nitrospirae bacterium]|nr:lipopolysaccharide biosynthesis protein RfbH [Nitrospirota bacterium]